MRSVSATASCTSHTGAIDIGTKTSGAAAHHSSITKSFHACTHVTASSGSGKVWNLRPANPGSVGNATLARMPLLSRSRARACGS